MSHGLNGRDLDNWITGHYGEDYFKEEDMSDTPRTDAKTLEEFEYHREYDEDGTTKHVAALDYEVLRDHARQLERELNEAHRGIRNLRQSLEETQVERGTLALKLAGAECYIKEQSKDIERYHWLRSEEAATDPRFYAFWHEFNAKLCREEKMDAAIDAAMRDSSHD